MAARIIPRTGFVEGRWRNGRGVSWDIASDGGAAEFGWRFAIARIDGDVPFSAYPGIDRVFTLIAGEGLTLEVAGMDPISVTERFAPARFPGDAATACRLRGGPCHALNLFVARDRWRAEVEIRRIAGAMRLGGAPVTLVHALRGSLRLDGAELGEGDAAAATGEALLAPAAGDALAYVARLSGVVC